MYTEHSAAVAAPPQRRRRPALSCLHCRSRKVKCDQKRPCSQCGRSKDAVCTYDSDFSNPQSIINPQTRETPENPGLLRLHHAVKEDFHISTLDPSTSAISISKTPHGVGPSIPSEFSPAADLKKLPENPAIENTRAFNDKVPKQNLLSYMVYSPDIERHVAPCDLNRSVDKGERSGRFKMKLIGENHWMNQITQLDKILSYFLDSELGKSPENPSELRVLLHRCKKLGRAIKSERPISWLNVPDFGNTIPSKDICDELVGNYLRTFESIYRIIHIPSFLSKYDEYWGNTGAESNRCSPFTMQLLLILAIGSAFQLNPSDSTSLRSAARQWVYTAQQWLSIPLEKSRMNITGIQIQCLLVLAREVVGIGSDLLWISAGSLLRTAIQLGYHRDPKHFSGMSILHGEMRRRLWATIVELAIKDSFVAAMPPMVSMTDFDTEPPANINDTDINQETKDPPIPRDMTIFTQTSLQIILLQSLQTRLEIAHVTTDFRSELSYDEVLRLHSGITNVCRKTQSLKNIKSNNNLLTSFQYNYFDFVIRRPLISLHLPWATKARIDPHFYFSRKVCLDTCLAMVSFSPSADYLRLLTVGQGVWLEIGSIPPLTIALEVMVQLEEEVLNPPSAIQAARAKAIREPLIQAIRDGISLKKERLKAVEVNVKGHLFASMTLGQIEAMESGENIEQKIAEAAISGLQESHAILEERASMLSKPGTQIEISPDWEFQNYGGTGDDFDYDSLMNTGLDFDMFNSGLEEDWNDHSWL